MDAPATGTEETAAAAGALAAAGGLRATTTGHGAKLRRAIAKIKDDKRKLLGQDKLASFADVVQAVAAFDADGRIRLDFDDNDDEYDISGLQQHDQQVEQFEATVRSDAVTAPSDVPTMNICIMIVGTRGDVQPFIGIAKRLQQDGHRVRLATHAVYRDFVTEHGVEFYPLGGDPKELAAYMVKTGGHLIPLKYETITKDVPRNMQMIDEILNSTWPAVSAPDPDGLGKGVPGQPFQAQAIISNPVTYGHIHVAERLGVPLHIMFPQPWVPTVAFPHPLSNMPYDDKPQKRNYMSYKLVDLLMWQGTESIVNQFRTQVLGLRKIRKGDGGRDMLLDLAIPHAFMWSPALVPKPDDWGSVYDVIGTVLLKEAGSKYTPTPELEAFLGSDGGPIFVGFGSMVIADPKATTTMIIEAARLANARVLIQSSWSDMAAGIDVPDNIFFIGNCPHDWLMPRVSAVVHHGGAGTTAAGLLAGKPTFIVPFFGDQPFWGRAVVRTGVGVEPCPISELSVEKLHKAFVGLQTPEIKARALALRDVMNAEDGVGEAVKCFYRHLPLKVMRCEVCEKHLATKWSEKDKIRLCAECEYVITSRPENSPEYISDYQCVDYGARGPDSTLEGVASGAGALLHELGSGVKDVFIKPAQGYREQGATGAVIGLTKGVVSGLFIRPIQGVAIFADHIATGVYNKNRDADERKRGSVWLENTRLGEAVGYNTTTAHTASMNPNERVLDKKANENGQVAIQLTSDEKQTLVENFHQIMAKREAKDEEAFHVVTSGSRDSVSSTVSDGSTLSTVSDVTSSINGEAKSVPKMNVCLLTTGTWDDSIQQFVAIGLRLKKDGHRVRIATNDNFRNRVTNAGLEFYPLGGHASTVSKYLMYHYERQKQKRGFLSMLKSDEFPESEDLKSLVFSLWPACVEVDPKSPGLPFRADMIISHPLVFGQTIVAERLGVPLHCVSPTPLSRTEAFPHLLKSGAKLVVPYANSAENAASFDAIETLLWKGMQDTLKSFRSSLGLLGTDRSNPLNDWQIPHSYLWNANLLPKPSDWGNEISIAGFVKLPNQADEEIDPSVIADVTAFVAEDSTPVLYFGFVRGDWEPVDVQKLVESIEVAAGNASVRVIFQIVEEDEADKLHRSKVVLEVPSFTSINSLLPNVAGAVHWGDSSVVATCLEAGLPSCVIARNATQRFWGQALACAGVGAEPLEVDKLTPSALAGVFEQLVQGPFAGNARRLSESLSSEAAVEAVVHHVYATLPLEGMRCDLDPTRVARIYDPIHELKLSYEAHLVVQSLESGEDKIKSDFLKYKPLKYSPTQVRFSLRQLDNEPVKSRRAKASRFSYEVAGKDESSGFSLSKIGQLSRMKSVAVNVVEAPTHWKSADVAGARVQEINDAYQKLLRERA